MYHRPMLKKFFRIKPKKVPVTQFADTPTSKQNNPQADSLGYGTFKGVFVPSLLTIFGVIMFLRLGWVVGNVGIFQTFVIVTLASGLIFITALSISAAATNMKVGGGGAYYIVSRSLGLEAGAAVGIPLYLAQALGISFYLAGFAESIASLIPQLNPVFIAAVALVALTVVAYISTNAVLKFQFFILLLIIAALVSFFMGNSNVPINPVEATEQLTRQAGFWVVFAVFFPAVTGVEAGLSMSGDLKNSAKSLPLGTISAVVLGYVVYMAIPYVLYLRVDSETLQTNSMILRDVAAYGSLIMAGIWGATLSSALGGILGAPRTLQALGRDRVVPSFLATGFGPQDEPRIATVITFIIALAGVLLGNLNAIAPILSMFFLTSYGALNLVAGMEGLISTPSWRPKFRTPATLSLAGAAGCCAAMFMIDPGATIIAIFLTFLVYYLMQRRKMRAQWGDMRRSILMLLARYSVYKLDELVPDAKTWRPHFLVLSGTPTTRWYLIELADAISHGKGFLTVAAVVAKDSEQDRRSDSLKRSFKDFMHKNHVPALVKIVSSDSVPDGLESMINNYGMGPLVPNTIVVGDAKKEATIAQFAHVLKVVAKNNRNLVVFRKGVDHKPRSKKRRIDVWWGRERQNAGFMLALGYLLQNSPEWYGSILSLNSVITSESEKDSAESYLQEYLEKSRIVAEHHVFVHSNPFQGIFEASRNSDLVLMGMRLIEPDETEEAYAKYYKTLLENTKNFPPTIFAVAGEKVKFTDIFQ